MLFKQLLDQEPWTYTYLIAVQGNTQIDACPALLTKHDLQLKYTLETHGRTDDITTAGLLM
ncbi:MAG: hypothetical protein PHY16_03430 [Methylobacter sp.]|nr:hypothetical protein [Methylobacter sp.]